MWRPDLVILFILGITSHVHAYVEALAANMDTGLSHFQPMVAILCGHGKYQNQYLDENKKWISDPDPKATCTKDKLEILEYCRKVYPKKDIRNIVESNRYYKVDKWCKNGQVKKCRTGKGYWVKPFRCLEGPFQSDALLVPEHCLFDHVHNQSVCQSSDYWNRTGSISCNKRSMNLQSFAMLLPCGVGIFSGVEFVCCPISPSTVTDNHIDNTQPSLTDPDDDDDDDDDDYYDDDYDDDDDDDDDDLPSSTTSTTSTTTTTERPIDRYLSNFDSLREHDSFKLAEKNLEDGHREKVTKVMKEWSELEEHYQEMKSKDSKAAEEFKKKMTNRFQKTVEALEEEGVAEKKQLLSMHQQRVMTIINMRKKSSMDCFTQSLDQKPAKTKRIEKCLEKLLRALDKDRTHTLHHFRHLLTSNTKEALREKDAMLDHLENLIRMGNQSIQMLSRSPSVSDKIRSRMITFWHNLRGTSIDEPITREAETRIMDRYEEEVAQKQQERERQKMLDEERRQELKEVQAEKKRVELNQKNGKLDRDFDPESMEDERTNVDQLDNDNNDGDDNRSGSTPSILSTNSFIPESNDLIQQHETIPTPKVAHISNQPFHQNQVTYSVRREPYHPQLKWSGSVLITLAFAGMAVLIAAIVGAVLLRKHTSSRSPLSQGFVEVDQTASPEERHVASMQINGYENPTFKYFEAHSA